MNTAVLKFFLFLVVIVAALAIICTLNAPDAASSASDIASSVQLEDNINFYKIELTEHAENSEHPEAPELIKCVEDKNVYQTYKSKFQSNKYYFICQMKDKRWGIVPVLLESTNLIIKTAFIPRDGTWNSILKYVSQEAVKFTGDILH
jgi:hypothetical protein